MARIKSSLKNVPISEQLSEFDYINFQIEQHNRNIGDLKGYNCLECKNKGYIAVMVDDHERLRECKCMNIRRNAERLVKSGLSQLLQECTFETYIAKEPWQKSAKLLAEKYIIDFYNHWFYAGGQVGSGKTHLCTAIAGYFLDMGKSAKYMLWRDEIVPLRAMVTDSEAYVTTINRLKKVEVLYIDDFFKTERGKQPSTADINIAFEILNYRYINRELITIISCEKHLEELIDIDEAVGSRIYQKTKEYCLNINNDRARNYRMRGDF